MKKILQKFLEKDLTVILFTITLLLVYVNFFNLEKRTQNLENAQFVKELEIDDRIDYRIKINEQSKKCLAEGGIYYYYPWHYESEENGNCIKETKPKYEVLFID